MQSAEHTRETGERRLVSNALASMANVVIGAVLVFLLYRLLLQRLGAGTLGIWSLMVASVGVVRLAELGVAASITRFVAAARAGGDHRHAAQVVETAAITLLALAAASAVVAWALLPPLLARFLTGEQLAMALQALPWTLGAFVLGLAGGAAQSGLDGCQRMDLRVYMSLAGQIVLLGCAIALVRDGDLVGIAIAQALQSAVVLVGSWLLLRGQVAGLPAVPLRWRLAVFRGMYRYSALFQLNTLLLLLLDPLTKFMLAHLGGLPATAYFDMANQLVQRLRQIPVAAAQALVPAMAHAAVQDLGWMRELYSRAYRAVFAATVPSFCLVALLAPAICTLWVGHVEPKLPQLVWICMAGWSISTIGTPAYFSNQGIGTIGANTIGHALTAVLSFALGSWWGMAWGVPGVTAGYVAGVAAGGLYVQLEFMKRAGVSLRSVLPEESRLLVAASVTGLLLGLACDATLGTSLSPHDAHPLGQLLRIFLLTGVFAAAAGPALWSHSLRRVMADRIRQVTRPASA